MEEYECDQCGEKCDGKISTACGDVFCSEDCMDEYRISRLANRMDIEKNRRKYGE